MPLVRICDVEGCDNSIEVEPNRMGQGVPDGWKAIHYMRSVSVEQEAPTVTAGIVAVEGRSMAMQFARVPDPEPAFREEPVNVVICERHPLPFDLKTDRVRGG